MILASSLHPDVTSLSEIMATLHFPSLAPQDVQDVIYGETKEQTAARGFLIYYCLGKGAGSCTFLFSLLSPNFPPHSNMGTVKQHK